MSGGFSCYLLMIKLVARFVGEKGVHALYDARGKRGMRMWIKIPKG